MATSTTKLATQQGGAPAPAQQQGQTTTPAPQQGQPIFRDWAAI